MKKVENHDDIKNLFRKNKMTFEGLEENYLIFKDDKGNSYCVEVLHIYYDC